MKNIYIFSIIAVENLAITNGKYISIINNTVINSAPVISKHIQARSFSTLSSLISRFFNRETVYWHGTSEGSIGEEQLKKREFEKRGEFDSFVWATEDRKMAESYAERSSQRTGTHPLIIAVKTDQALRFVEHGKHSFPAFNTRVAPIIMTEIQRLKQAS